MMRNYQFIDKYLNSLVSDIYPQPPDPGHTAMALQVIDKFVPSIKIQNVLDIGCGQGFLRNKFVGMNIDWTGITLGDDYKVCFEKGYKVFPMDMSFLDLADNSFDLLFTRHVLEHSPFPLLTLMEWYRVSKKYLIVVLPSPKFFKFFGRNHYAVMTNTHFLWLAARAGWRAIQKDYTHEQELRYLLTKDQPQIELPFESEAQLQLEYGEI